MKTTLPAQVATFNFNNFPIRTVNIDGQPWFIARDVCECLGISNYRDALSRLRDSEKGVGSTDTLGGNQEVSIINEPGLYRLTFTSRKPEAQDFQDWVYSEVLPAIRQTGAYMPDMSALRALIQSEAVQAVNSALLTHKSNTAAIDKARRRKEQDEITAMIQGYLGDRDTITARELVSKVFKADWQESKGLQRAIGQSLRELGFYKVQVRVKGKGTRLWLLGGAA